MDALINTLECPGEFDALATLRPGEPYIIFVGRDRLAPPLVSEWADANRRRALKEFGEGLIDQAKLDRELRKSTQADMIAASMRQYKQTGTTDDPKIKSKPVTYTGHQLPAETEMRDRLQSARSRAVSALHNAIAEVGMLATIMNEATIAGHGEHDPHDAQVVVGKMRDAAERLTPKLPVR